ncbi:hypothetical protein ACOI9Q_24475, partial [Klebsiella sp. C228]|uniref:hypothetical protein n=1 Tax=Klebsiella TaxID=570 RepID=UPI001CBA7BE5
MAGSPLQTSGGIEGRGAIVRAPIESGLHLPVCTKKRTEISGHAQNRMGNGSERKRQTHDRKIIIQRAYRPTSGRAIAVGIYSSAFALATTLSTVKP